MAKGIVVGGQKIDLIDAPVTGDVAITHEGVSTVGDGKITVDMLDSTLLEYVLPPAEIDVTDIDYCLIE